MRIIILSLLLCSCSNVITDKEYYPESTSSHVEVNTSTGFVRNRTEQVPEKYVLRFGIFSKKVDSVTYQLYNIGDTINK